MYTPALSIALGLACLVQSLGLFGGLCIYVVLLAQLVPAEEDTLRIVYGEQYGAYRRETRRIIPFVY